MLTRSQLKDIFSARGFTPLKRLGENYLIDGNVKNKIIGNAGIDKDDIILEIGPGFGALTVDLASTGAKVFAVEKDRKACEILKEIVNGNFKNLKIFNGDVLEFSIEEKISPAKRLKVFGNLPYYITTPIIEYLISNRRFITLMLIVVQREVADRVLAAPGSKDYGSLSCFIQYYCKVSYLHTIKRTSFYPVPDVDSSLLKLEVLNRPSVKVGDEQLLFKIIRGAFNQRRKTILNSLSRAEVLDLPKERLLQVLEKTGIDPLSRPEDLPLSAFARLTNTLECDNLY